MNEKLILETLKFILNQMYLQPSSGSRHEHVIMDRYRQIESALQQLNSPLNPRTDGE